MEIEADVGKFACSREAANREGKGTLIIRAAYPPRKSDLAARHVRDHRALAGVGRIQLRDQLTVPHDGNPIGESQDLVEPVRNVEDRPAGITKAANNAE